MPKMKKAPQLPPMDLKTWPTSVTICSRGWGQGWAGRHEVGWGEVHGWLHAGHSAALLVLLPPSTGWVGGRQWQYRAAGDAGPASHAGQSCQQQQRTRESARVLAKKPSTSSTLNVRPSSWRPVSWASRSCMALRAGKWFTGKWMIWEGRKKKARKKMEKTEWVGVKSE